MIKAYFKLNYQVNPFWRGNEKYFMEDLETKSPLKTSYIKIWKMLKAILIFLGHYYLGKGFIELTKINKLDC